MVYSTRRFVVCLTMCHFVLVFFSPFSIAITSIGEERANLSAFRTFVRFVLVWICRFPLPLGVWEGLRFVIVALPGLFSFFFYCIIIVHVRPITIIFYPWFPAVTRQLRGCWWYHRSRVIFLAGIFDRILMHFEHQFLPCLLANSGLTKVIWLLYT